MSVFLNKKKNRNINITVRSDRFLTLTGISEGLLTWYLLLDWERCLCSADSLKQYSLFANLYFCFSYFSSSLGKNKRACTIHTYKPYCLHLYIWPRLHMINILKNGWVYTNGWIIPTVWRAQQIESRSFDVHRRPPAPHRNQPNSRVQRFCQFLKNCISSGWNR